MTGSDRPLVVSLLAGDGVLGAFGLGVAAEVFGYDHRRFGMPRFDFAMVTDRPGVVRTDTGLALYVEHGLERLAVTEDGRFLGILPREPLVRRIMEDDPPPESDEPTGFR